MPIANYTTSVNALKTVGEIQGILVGHGARQILLNYDQSGVIESLSFIADTPYGSIPFRLPADARAVLKVLENGGAPPRYCTHEQAVMVAWRILKDWVRAQMALLETEMVRIEQVFLPYMVVDKDRTLYDHMVNHQFMLKEGRNEDS